MERKYKFFIKDRSVIFTEKEGISEDSYSAQLGKMDQRLLKFWINKLDHLEVDQDETVELENLDAFMFSLFSELTLILAGGGFVLNESNQVLMIHRRGFWDLPKGKLNKGETIQECAVREVEEECGIDQLEIVSDSFHTYHLYQERSGETVIKDSTWYIMETGFNGDLIPQIEEDIEEAVWVKLPVASEIVTDAYASIREVIDHFQDQLLEED